MLSILTLVRWWRSGGAAAPMAVRTNRRAPPWWLRHPHL
jgi:hypothetical protein